MRGLMNSLAPISGFVCLSLASRAICASWGVRTSRVSTVRLRRGLAGGQQLAAGALGERLGADPVEASRGRLAAARARRRAGSRDAAIRRRGAGRGRGGPRRGCARAARPPRGRGARRLGRSLSSAREPASMPSAQSVPLACVRSLRRSSAAAAASVAPLRTPASISSTRAQREEPDIVVLAGPLGGRERLGVAAVAVVEQRGGPVGDAQRHALAPCRRPGQPGLDQLQRPRPRCRATRPASATRSFSGASAGRLDDRVGLLDQRRSGGERSRMNVRGTRDRWPRSGARGARPSRARRAARASRARTRARRPRGPAARRHASQSQRTSRAVNPSTSRNASSACRSGGTPAA